MSMCHPKKSLDKKLHVLPGVAGVSFNCLCWLHVKSLSPSRLLFLCGGLRPPCYNMFMGPGDLFAVFRHHQNIL